MRGMREELRFLTEIERRQNRRVSQWILGKKGGTIGRGNGVGEE